MKVRAYHRGDKDFKPQWLYIFGLSLGADNEIAYISFSGVRHPSTNHPNIKKKIQRDTLTNVRIEDHPIDMYYERETN